MTTACTSDFSEAAKILRAANPVCGHISAMQAPALPPGTTQRTLAIIMGGGAGTRLFPLTKDRAKPAVPLGGKYRLVDIPISNCLNSGLRSIYLLTQFNTMSLHRHIQASYKFDNFSRSFVDILAAEFGIMSSGEDRRITRFVEKPKEAKVLDEMKMDRPLLTAIGHGADEELFQASMGIYIFNRNVLIECLNNDLFDFGKDVIPAAIQTHSVSAFIFDGYWEDIGTIRAFYEANLDLTDLVPAYSFFESDAPIYTHPRFLPGSKINGASLRQAIISDGCIISDGHIERSVIGVRSIIQSGATIRNSVVMGADFYELDSDRGSEIIPIGIGRNCVIDRAIIDKNARIADGVVVTPEGKPENFDAENYYIRDGIVVIPKNATIPPGFWI